MQKTCDQKQNADGPMGIRTGVWLIVFGLLSVCVILVTLFSSAGDRPANEAAFAPAGESPHGFSKPSKARAWQPDLQFSGLGPSTPQDAEEAARFASLAANQRARELFDCEPFGDERPARLIDGRWVWSDSRGQGRSDLEATVEFAADGTVQSVDVLWLDSSPGLF
jgi:hypothetical protein